MPDAAGHTPYSAVYELILNAIMLPAGNTSEFKDAAQSLSEVVSRDSKIRSAKQKPKPSEGLKAAGLDPETWTEDPWKHMQRKEIPTRYDNELEDTLFEGSESAGLYFQQCLQSPKHSLAVCVPFWHVNSHCDSSN